MFWHLHSLSLLHHFHPWPPFITLNEALSLSDFPAMRGAVEFQLMRLILFFFHCKWYPPGLESDLRVNSESHISQVHKWDTKSTVKVRGLSSSCSEKDRHKEQLLSAAGGVEKASETWCYFIYSSWRRPHPASWTDIILRNVFFFFFQDCAQNWENRMVFFLIQNTRLSVTGISPRPFFCQERLKGPVFEIYERAPMSHHHP